MVELEVGLETALGVGVRVVDLGTVVLVRLSVVGVPRLDATLWKRLELLACQN